MKISPVDSQGVDSSPSLALLSEPPDIRNWFPSYKYESFVLDTMDDLGDSMFKESGGEEDGLLVGETDREKEDKFGDSSKNKITDVLCSPSLSSEPPLLENWVSKSPGLDTADYFSEYAVKDSELQSFRFGIEANSKEKEENFGGTGKCENINEVDADEKQYSDESLKCKPSPPDVRGEKTRSNSEVPDFSESSSFLSEPPDIRNWFPSYVYETPELGESERLLQDGNSITEDDLVDIDRQKSTLNGMDLDERPQTTRFLNYIGSTTNGMQEKNLDKANELERGKDSFSHDNLRCEREQRLEYKIFPEQDINSAGVQKSSLDKSSNNPSNSGKISPRKLICRKNSTYIAETKAQTKANLLSPRNDGKFIGCSEFPVREPYNGSNDKEKEGKHSSSNGYVTTRKTKTTRSADYNYMIRRPENAEECSRNTKAASTDAVENVIAKRKVLSERTNLEDLEGIDVTGKWKCPQNGKTNVGPPLKQLRLERWVHKI